MNVQLAPELTAIVEDQVANGNYSSPAEVIRESLLLLAARNRTRQSEAEQVYSEIATGLAQAEAGNVKSFDASDLLRRIEERFDTQQQGV